MKNLAHTAAVLALMIVANIPSAIAQESKTSGGSTCPWASHTTDPSASNTTTTTAHYEYQYGYDHHSAWRGHWVLVR
jgi:hypothetical protein